MNLTSAWISRYISDLSELTTATQSTVADGSLIGSAEAIDWVVGRLKKLVLDGGKLMVVGNGGSAAIASHVAIDYSKNGKIPAIAFNDPASLTCLTNDLGYENVFSHHIQMLGNPQDLLFAISSSGESQNILNAAVAAQEKSIPVVTLSGFSQSNALRSLGAINFYVPSAAYGFVEIGHLTLCHAILDFSMGWRPEGTE